MPKQAISITLEADNLTWLKGRAGASGVRSVSELLDQLVTAAREAGGAGHATSVVGTIDIDPGDPLLERADEAVGALFDGAHIHHIVLDQNMSILEGSLGILPRRIMVDADEIDRARTILADAGIGNEIKNG